METKELNELLAKADSGDVEAQNQLGNLYTDEKGALLDYTEGVKWYKKAAEAGFVKAQYNLAFCYKNGQGVVENNITALEWMKKAADQDDIDALKYVGAVYHDGEEGVEQDKKKAMRYYMRGAQLKDVQSMLLYAHCCEEEHQPQAEKMLLEALNIIDKDDDTTQFILANELLGSMKLASDDAATAIEHLKKAAECGSANSKNTLYRLSVAGYDVKLTDEVLKIYVVEAANENMGYSINAAIKENINGYRDGLSEDELIEKLQIAAKDDMLDAQIELGKRLVKRNQITEATHWLLKGVEVGNADACYEVALIYRKVGNLTAENIKTIITLMETASSKDHFEATVFLSQYYCDVLKDSNKGRKYHQVLAEKGYKPSLAFLFEEAYKKKNIKDCIYYLERMNSNDPVVEKSLMDLYRIAKDYPKYYEMANKLALANDTEAIVEMSKICFNGYGTKQDYKASYDWLLKANNHPEALYMLGKFAEFGYIEKEDYDQAVFYYQQASALGHKEASLDVNRFKKSVFGKWKKIK